MKKAESASVFEEDRGLLVFVSSKPTMLISTHLFLFLSVREKLPEGHNTQPVRQAGKNRESEEYPLFAGRKRTLSRHNLSVEGVASCLIFDVN